MHSCKVDLNSDSFLKRKTETSVGVLACLHRVGIYNNKHCVLSMDSNIYLEENLPFHDIKKETYCHKFERCPYSALLNVVSKCHVGSCYLTRLNEAPELPVEQVPSVWAPGEQ